MSPTCLLRTVVNIKHYPFVVLKYRLCLDLKGVGCGQPSALTPDLLPPWRWSRLSAASAGADCRGPRPRTPFPAPDVLPEPWPVGAGGQGVPGRQLARPAGSAAAAHVIIDLGLGARGLGFVEPCVHMCARTVECLGQAFCLPIHCVHHAESPDFSVLRWGHLKTSSIG